MYNPELFWNATLEELKRGYIEYGDSYVCILCGERFEKGIIYSHEKILYEAEKYTKLHIEKAHGSSFEYLISLDKRLTGLTDHQRSLIQLFYEGKSDAEIQKEMAIGSASTIRNHRFSLREKERQAKLFLAIMELLKEKDKNAPAFVEIHKTATMIDDRYNITEDETQKVLKKYFTEGPEKRLKTFYMKEKYKLIILREIIKKFDTGKVYSEKEVNEILKTVYDDYVTIRRYLIEYGFLDRKLDCSQYWVKE